MAGQWLGKFSGTNVGDLILDLDDYGEHVAGHALAFDADAQLPGVLISLAISKTALAQRVVSKNLEPLDPIHPVVISKSDVRSRGLQFPDSIELDVKFDGDFLQTNWTSDIGTTGGAALTRPNRARIWARATAQ